jgi:hypothetical protein
MATHGVYARVLRNETSMRVVIDPEGTIIDADWFTRRLRCLPNSVSVLNYVVGTIGFVWFETTQKGCRIYLCPPKIQPAMEAALYRTLLEQQPSRVLVWFGTGAGQCRIYASASKAIAGIAIVIWGLRRERSNRFVSRPVNFATLKEFPSLQHLLDVYRASERSIDLLQQREFLGNLLHSRYLIAEGFGGDDILRIRSVGSGYRAFDTSWSTKSAGTRLDEQPDVDYGMWLAISYRRALAEMQAQLEEVEAIIYRPRHGRRRFAYRRLMLPFATADGRELVLSASVTDTSINLGVDKPIEAS